MLLSRIAIALLPVLAWAQEAQKATPGAPPEVDKALRARVNQFFQYHVDGDFRHAMDLVAEDTKDEYFGNAKMHLKNYELTAIKYSDNFTKASVETTVTTTWTIRLQENVSVVPMVTTWKIEDGKWMWYHDRKDGSLLPMGESKQIAGVNDPGAKRAPIPEKIDEDAVNNAAVGIVKQIAVDKSSVILSADKPSSAKVNVHNGTPGYVKLSLAAVPEIPGFKATLNKTDVGPSQDATLTVEFNGEAKETRPPFDIRIVVEPFNQVFPVKVSLGEPQSVK